MRLHTGSFLLGYAAGAGTVLLGRRLRPALVEMATSAYKVLDALAARVAIGREDFEDILAEAKARARRGRANGEEGRANGEEGRANGEEGRANGEESRASGEESRQGGEDRPHEEEGDRR